MDRRKREVEVVDGVSGKTCNKCGIWKPLGDYFNDKDGVGGKYSICKECKNKSNDKYKEYRNEYAKKHYRENKEYHDERNRRYREENRDAIIAKNRKYRETHKEQRAAYLSQWCKDNKIRRQATELRRRAKMSALDNEFPYDKQTEVLSKFGGCALSGSDDIHWDHVIPLSIGHFGTSYGNMIPLRSDLNLSKQDSNMFEWFEANRQRFNLSQEKFDILIKWLANVNGVSVEDYRDYVYWCHENPYSLDELRDNDEGEAI